MRFSLDSNAVIALIKGKQGVIDRLRQHGIDAIGLSSIVVHEIYHGARGSDRVAESIARLDELPFTVMAFDRDDALAAAEIRQQLQRAGTPVGHFDLLIAAQTLARDLTLVTRNAREFQRIPGLRLADWETA
ncbi:MAG: type II toxin-antitoxin system VapC family toxin [Steroidobacteraceae bacterium]